MKKRNNTWFKITNKVNLSTALYIFCSVDMKCKIRNQLIYFKRNAGDVLVHCDGRLRGIEVFTLVTPRNITVFIWGVWTPEIEKERLQNVDLASECLKWFSEDLNFKTFPGEDAPYPYRRGCPWPPTGKDAPTTYRKPPPLKSCIHPSVHHTHMQTQRLNKLSNTTDVTWSPGWMLRQVCSPCLHHKSDPRGSM